MATTKAKAAPSDVDVLSPEPTQVTLQSGIQVEILPLKSKQFFKLLRIITRGAGQAIKTFDLNPNDSDDAFGARLVATLVFSIPEAEDETVEFLQSMCKPVGLIERPESSLNKQDKERNLELWSNLLIALENPELDDTVTIVEAIALRETPNLKALGKRLMQMFQLAQKTGQA